MRSNLTILFLPLILFVSGTAHAQYWQQHVSYDMKVVMDVKTHRFDGMQKLVYTNNSPDTLHKVFYHLYFNAFQPGSAMDVRSRSIVDPDPRVGDRISKLNSNEIGYQKVTKLSQDGAPLTYTTEGTVLEVGLNKPILPGESTTFEMDFKAQIPKQIRRSGRDNAEGVAYSMTQWYPKMAEYDQEGWHADPYVGREFFGVFGDYDIKISIAKGYVLGGTGYLQNPRNIGHGYENGLSVEEQQSDMVIWHFKASNVHDFAWAADPNYIHDIKTTPNGTAIHFLYLPDSTGNWVRLQDDFVKAFELMNENFGTYPYGQFSVIQGGDGGMEYPMTTLITSGRNYNGLLSVAVHEALHNWYYGVLATNEAKFPWMDEGFTSFAQDHILNLLSGGKFANPHLNDVKSLAKLYENGLQEPLSTHADHYQTNTGYGVSAYSKGAVFLLQLEYMIGKDAFWNGLKRYYNDWQFKHPTPNDFIRVMEKVSGLELNWFLDLWVGTTQFIDYKIELVDKGPKGQTTIVINRSGALPMPLDILLVDADGVESWYYIPLDLLRGEKPAEDFQVDRSVLADWEWTNPSYSFDVDIKKRKIKSIQIDPSGRLADLNNLNGIYPFPKESK